MATRRKILVLHLAGRYPMAGVGWQAVHYMVGLARLGHDVYYVEDSGAPPYDPRARSVVEDPAYSTEFVARAMARIGMGDRWAYVDPVRGRCDGLGRERLRQLYRDADALLNVCGATRLRHEHVGIPVRIYVETDPGAVEIKIAQGDADTISMLDAHTHHVTYGENLGSPDSSIPLLKFSWKPTRPPVVPSLWTPTYRSDAKDFTTVGTWDTDRTGIEYEGQVYYWSKHQNLAMLRELPRSTAQTFELALGTVTAEERVRLRDAGWRLADPYPISSDLDGYRRYIEASRGEFSVEKDVVVRSRSGWFSDRSVCYLAAGKPVVVQDTGFSKRIPVGHGLFAFSTIGEAVAAIDTINGDYAEHCRAAREIAIEYFASDRVLDRLLSDAGL